MKRVLPVHDHPQIPRFSISKIQLASVTVKTEGAVVEEGRRRKKSITRLIAGRFRGKRAEIAGKSSGTLPNRRAWSCGGLHGHTEENKEERDRSYEFVSDFGYHVRRRLVDISFGLPSSSVRGRAALSFPLLVSDTQGHTNAHRVATLQV